MRHALLSAAIVSAALFGISAHAGGSAEAAGYSWTGIYGGVNAGYGKESSDWDFAGGGVSHDDYEALVGIQVGYNAQLSDTLVAGVEASLDATRLNSSAACLGGQTCETHVSSIGDISARLGVISGQALLYGKGGIAYADNTHHLKSPGVDRHDNGGEAYGYLLGGGAEYALSYSLSAKAEYNYMNFGSRDSAIAGTAISTDEPLHVVKAGINYKFSE